MSKVDELFQRLRGDGRKALMPFITAGDPDFETTVAILNGVKAAGADLCEIGVPYSDPIADGPVIQESYQRALDSGFRLDGLFDLPSQVRNADAQLPLVTMASYSIIYRMGLRQYVQRAIDAGYAGAIVPDLLVEEAGPLSKVCSELDFSLVLLVTPTTSRDRQIRIAESSTGFLYFVSVTGITGERAALPETLGENVRWLKQRTDLPICIGFGISGPETAAQLAPVADGLIVGSAVVRRIAAASDRDDAVKRVSQFVGELRTAIDSAPVD
ncbi:tryptophan synthase subunit alpha [Crateriforma conspicua]|uniref:Tryptophan synthase alpha chain n=1 Tax=Crateriforma conspicua TaxID=2527996 RepID=A0A5C6FTC3_9PLAN|nr:tryptophan synthase subunit alpha [Crateriforma conspicua]TWU65611.1 Tryptophan synthase alpha chain [Crateriforma conspicua]